MIHPNAVPDWSPAVGSADAPVPSQWLDASDTTTIDKAGPAPITNGATVLEWRTKAGTLRKYRLIGPNVAPTWDANVVGSLGGVRCNGNVANGQILSADVLTGMQSLAGRTVIVAFKFLTLLPTFGQGFTVTVPHQTGSADGPQILMYCGAGTPANPTPAIAGKRLQADTAVGLGALTASGAQRPLAAGEIIVDTGIFNFSTGKMSIFLNGVAAAPDATLTSTGVTAALNPYAMSVGGILQENGPRGPNTGNGFMDGHVLEVLDWFQALTPDQLVGPHDYLCNKWGGGLM